MENYNELNQFTQNIIGCAIEVHRNLGPGLLESIYEKALCRELDLNEISYEKQKIVPIIYKNEKIGEHRLDLIIENQIILELKAIDRFELIFEAQLLSYLKLSNKKIGLLINFNVKLLKDGIKRIIL